MSLASFTTAVFVASGALLATALDTAASADVDETLAMPTAEGPVSIAITADGTLIAWAQSDEFAASIEVRVAGEVRATAQSTSAQGAARVRCDVFAGDTVELQVGARLDAVGNLRLRVIELPHSPATDEHVATLRAIAQRAQAAATSQDRAGLIAAVRAGLESHLTHGAALHPAATEQVRALLRAIVRGRDVLGEPQLLAEERLELKEQVLAAFNHTRPVRDLERLNMLFGVAEESRQLGRAERSATLYREVLDLAESALEPDLGRVQIYRHLLGALLFSLGELPEAAETLERFLRDTHRTTVDDPYALSVEFNLIGCRVDLGDGYGALELVPGFLSAYETTYADNPVELSRAHYVAARAYNGTGDRKRARELYEDVVRVRTEHLEPTDVRLLNARDALAGHYSGDGDYAAALRLREEIHAAYSQALPAENPNRLRALRNLSVDRSIAGSSPSVAKDFKRILDTFRERSDHYETALTWMHLGWHGLRERDDELLHPAALGAARTLVDVARLHSTTFSPREAETSVLLFESVLGGALSFGANLSPEIDAELFTMVEGMRSVGLRSARLMRAALRGSETADLRRDCVRLSEELVAATRAGHDVEQLGRLRRELEVVQRELVAEGRSSALGPDPTPRALADVLQVGEVLVAYRKYLASHVPQGARVLESRDAYLAFVLRRGAEPRAVLLGPADAIDEAALDWLAAIGRADDTVAARRARDLARLVLEPLTEIERAARVTLVLDGELQSVPFDALPLAREDTPLLADHARVSVLSSCWELLVDTQSRSHEGPEILVAMGDVDYHTAAPAAASSETAGVQPARPTARLVRARTAAGFLELPSTGGEVSAIAGLFRKHIGGEARVLTGNDADRSALQDTADASYLHLATHGYFSMQAFARGDDAQRVRGMHPMMLCGLALAGANVPSDASGNLAGVVTAQELTTLDLEKCRLVVLSACDTHLGVPLAGQGLASLQKAARMAGAERVITSLWRVDDTAASELMEAFYRYLWGDSLPADAALWAAKNDMRADGRPVREWAGWILTGRTAR